MRKSTKFTDSEPGSSSPLQRSKIRPTSISSSKSVDRNHLAAGSSRMTRSLSDTKKEFTSTNSHKATSVRRLSEPKNTKIKTAESVSKSKSKSSDETKKITEPSKVAEPKITTSSNLISQKVKVKEMPTVATTSEVVKPNSNNKFGDADPVIDKAVVMLEHKKQPSSITNHSTETVDKGTISIHSQKPPVTSSEVKKYEAPYARISSFEDQSTRNSEYAKAVPHRQTFSNLKPQSKVGGGFRKLINLGKKTPSLPVPVPPQVDTLKSLISADEHAQKSSRRLFSFHFRGSGS